MHVTPDRDHENRAVAPDSCRPPLTPCNWNLLPAAARSIFIVHIWIVARCIFATRKDGKASLTCPVNYGKTVKLETYPRYLDMNQRNPTVKKYVVE